MTEKKSNKNREISIADLLNIENPEDYKLHLGCRSSEGDHPLDLFIEDPNNWVEWNEWRGDKDDWTRDYIFSLIEFSPKQGTWLFGGVFKVLEKKDDSYVIEEVKKYSQYTGRLLLNFHRYQGMRGRAYYLENYIKDITVNQIFEYRYTGEIFPGYENINHDYSVLETIFKTEKSDWKTALENVKGVYLITDKKNGKMYVGSAYGEGGIWERWSNYICSLDGGNKQLMELINNKGEKYVQNNFKYTLLEIFAMHASAESIIERENYWKEKLMTREHGYNSN